MKQARLRVPHSRIQVELGFILQAGTCQILNFAQNPRQSQSVQGTELNFGGGGTAHQNRLPVQITSSVDGWVAGPVILVPLCGSILQAETCQILSLAENPKWSPSVAIPQKCYILITNRIFILIILFVKRLSLITSTRS